MEWNGKALLKGIHNKAETTAFSWDRKNWWFNLNLQLLNRSLNRAGLRGAKTLTSWTKWEGSRRWRQAMTSVLDSLGNCPSRKWKNDPTRQLRDHYGFCFSHSGHMASSSIKRVGWLFPMPNFPATLSRAESHSVESLQQEFNPLPSPSPWDPLFYSLPRIWFSNSDGIVSIFLYLTFVIAIKDSQVHPHYE